MELQYYKNRKHCEDTFAKLMQDKSIEPLGNEFFALIIKGSSLVTGGFSSSSRTRRESNDLHGASVPIAVLKVDPLSIYFCK